MIKQPICLFMPVIMFLCQPICGQRISSKGSALIHADPLISKLYTLSIHVRDTVTHDSVFHFFIDKLKLPVYYYPSKYGQRRYAGIYAGNLVLEPCGPYTTFNYATSDFRAIFFGLTYYPYKTTSASERGLSSRGIVHPETGFGTSLYLTDTMMCKENIIVGIMGKPDSIRDRVFRDSLRTVMKNDTRNDLGILCVKEIWVGFTDDHNLQKWRDFIYPSEIKGNILRKEDNSPEIYFVQSNIKEVKGIVFRVRSLEKARSYLLKNNLIGSASPEKIELDKSKAFGLLISLTGED